MTLSIANAQAIQGCDAFVDACDLGSTNASAHVRIYSGTPPTLVDDALSGNTLLAELVMSNPAFGAATDINPGARATASAISDDTTADAGGTATFFRILDRNNTPRIQGSITATGGGGDMTLNTVSIVINALVKVTSLTTTMPEG